METVREIVLVAAAVSMGLMAGVFGLYSHTVMPGLRRTDDRTFVGAFQALDRAIINPWFMLTGFLGALVLTGAAAVLLAGPGGPALSWTLVALVLYLIVFLITVAVNVPKNNALKAAGEPDTITDLAGVRAASTRRPGRGGTSSGRSPPPSRRSAWLWRCCDTGRADRDGVPRRDRPELAAGLVGEPFGDRVQGLVQALLDPGMVVGGVDEQREQGRSVALRRLERAPVVARAGEPHVISWASGSAWNHASPVTFSSVPSPSVSTTAVVRTSSGATSFADFMCGKYCGRLAGSERYVNASVTSWSICFSAR
ncbi:DUF1772 domain-containing protein [Catellatospora bangladeshensis]|uniref:anthrone oxygenase family protein n=1 Tax=Catellatospora bangladeshensis TaxID=310355 RepID=UPI0036080117